MALPIEGAYSREDFHLVCFNATDEQLRLLYERECKHEDDGTAEGLLNLLCAAVAEMEMVRRGLLTYPMSN